jgi:hypothetical protein
VDADIPPPPSGGDSAVNNFDGVPLSPMSHDTPVPDVPLNRKFTSDNSSLTATCPEGIIPTATNRPGPWTPVRASSPSPRMPLETWLLFPVQIRQWIMERL